MKLHAGLLAAATFAAPRALTGAPMRRRRSARESAPPNAISTAPSQINVTSGFQYARTGSEPSAAG